MAGELDANLLKNLDERLKSMNETLGGLQKSIEGVGSAMSIAFGSAAQKMVSDVQQAFRGAQLVDMLGVDQARLNIDKLEKDIIRLKGNLRTHTEGEVVWNAKSGNWKYNRGEENSLKDEKATRDALNDAIQKLNYSRMSESQLAMKFGQTSAKMAEEEEKRLLNLIKLRNQYKESIASLMADTRVSMKRNNGEMTPFDQKNIELARERAKVVVEIENELTRVAQQTEEQRKSALIKGNTQLENEELRHQERMNAIRRQEYKGIAGQQSINPVWNDMMARANEREQAIAKATEGYIKKQQKLDELYAKLDQQNLKLQSQREKGVSESSQKKTQSEIAKTEAAIKRAENAQQAFVATLLSTDKGRVALAALRNEFGLVEEEEKNVASVFDRVIADINSRAERSQSRLAKEIIDAQSFRDEAKAAAANVANELSYIWKGASTHNLDALKLRKTFSLTDFGVQEIANQIKLSDQYKANLDSLKPEARERLTEALNKYKEALLQVLQLEEQSKRIKEQYNAQERAINGVTRRYQENEQAIQKLKDRWEEMNVKKQAGLINEKDFKQNTQTILDEYDKLINKRKEFEVGDLGEMSTERQRAKIEEEQRLAQIRKDNERARVQDELNADKKIAAERARRARGLASTDPNMNAAVKKQIQYQRQLTSLRKEYNTLNAKQNRTKEENIILEQTKQKIKDIINLSRQLNNEQKGSHNLAKQITDYDRIKQKIREANESIKELNDSTKKIISTAKRLSSAFGVAFSVRSLVNFGKKLIETRGEFEIQQVALRSILQNKQLADEIWEKTMSAALQSPFTAMQLTRYTKQLSAYRIETEKLFDTTKRLADVSAGLGVDMGRLILAYGQVKAANYLRASEIRQFTEAGVNILGELRDYFNETKGMAISTADVMDKVQKRLVKFEDVEAIFKRLTDQGGIFYNMQYIQSQTLKGQINKLHDAYDQMLNDIGKSNQGVLKEFVDTFNSIVKNWRTWSVVIKSIAFGGITVYITRLAQAIGVLSIKGSTASKSIKGLAVSLRNLGRSIKGNITSIGIGSVVALITAFISLGNRMSENNKVIEEQLLRLRETRVGFEKLESKIKANNSKIQNGTKNQKELNKAQKENKAILAKLKDEYPQLASQMSIATNGVIDMNNALTIQNRKLREQATLIAMQSQKNLFSDTMQKNLQEAEGELARKRAAISRMQAEAKAELAKLEAEASKISNVEFGKFVYSEGTEDILLLTKKAKILKSIVDFKETENVEDDLDEMRRLDKEYSDKNWFERWFGGGSMTFLETGDFLSENVRGFKESLEEQLPLIAKYYEQAIMDNKKYAEEIKNTSGGFKEWLSKNVDRLNKDAEEGINKANETIIKVFKATTPEGRRMISEAINSYLKIGKGDAVEKAADDLGKVMAQGISRGFSAEWAKEVKEKSTILSNAKKLIDFFAEYTKGSNGGEEETTEEKKSKIDAMWRRRIALLEEMRKRYEELSKSAYNFSESDKVVRKEFKDSWEKTFGKDLSMSAIMFGTSEQMETSFKTLLSKAGAASDALKEELLKKSDSWGARIPISLQVRIREDFAKQMEDAFGNYELSLDLQKLNLPSDVLSDMFDIDNITLPDLREKVSNYYKERVATETDPTDLIKQVEGFYKKIDDMERKQQRERIKDYAKLLEYELSERAKIEMEYTRKVSAVFAESAFTNEQKEQIRKRLTEERDKALAKQEWEDFKGSETYIQMMEDLEHQGTNALVAMRTELEKIRDNAENLSPRALKEVINAIEKIDEIEIKRGMPISNIKRASDAVKSARVEAMESGLKWDQVSSREAARQTQADIKEQLLPMEKQYNLLQSQIVAEKEIERLEHERYENGKKLNEVFGESFMTGINEDLQDKTAEILDYIELTRENITSLEEKNVTATEEEQKELSTILANEKNYLSDLYKQKELLEKQLEYNKAIAVVELQRAATPEERAQLQAKIDALEEQLKKLREQDSYVNSLNNKYKNLDKATVDAVQKLSQWGQQAVDVFNSFKTMMTSLGVDTDTDAWDDISTAFENLGTVASTATSMATKIASGDWVGAIMDGVKGVMDVVSSWAGNSDKELEREIQREQRKIDELKRAYERLEKQIQKTWSSIDYIDTYDRQVENIKRQIEAMERQLALERDKKDTDESKIISYQEAIDDAYDELDELKQKQIEVFGGIGEEGYRSAAEGFVDAWKEAFLETGDGLQGLQDHFDEFLQEWFVKQATMRIAGNMLERTFRMIDDSVNKSSEGGVSVTMAELQAIRDEFAAQAPLISEALEDLAGMFDIQGEGGLSGLAAGIQGMTEEQANILEAYWNSVRMYTANIDVNVERIASILGAGGINTNPQLQQLQTIAQNTQAIHTLLEGVTKSGHPEGGRGIKVFNN